MQADMAQMIAGIFLGIAIALFHRPIADYILEQERALVVLFQQRGVPVPPVPTRETAHTVYFFLGIMLSLVQALRLWFMLR